MSNPDQARTIPVAWSLFGAFGLLVVLICGGTLIVESYVHARMERDHTRELIDRTQDQTEVELQRLLDPISNAARQAQEWTRLGLVKRYDEAALMALFLPQMRNLPQSCSMMVSDMTGYEFLIMRNLGPGGLLDTPSSAGTWITRDFRRDERGTQSRWALWDEEGRTCVKRWERELEYDPRGRVWHEGPRKLNKGRTGREASIEPQPQIYWTGIDMFFTSKTPGITASVAVQDPAGETVVIGYDLLFSDLSRYTQELEPTEHGMVFVITEEGQLVGLPRHSKLADQEAVASAILQPIDEVGIEELAAASVVWRAHDSDRVRPTRIEVDGQAWWIAFRPFQISPQQQVWIGVAIPEQDVAPQGESRGVLGIALVAILVASVLTFLMSRSFCRSLQALVRESDRIATLDLSANTSQTQSRLREVGQLSLALERIRSSLARHVDERKQAKEAQSETEGKYRRLIENLPGSYFFYSHGVDGVFTYLSPSITNVLGYSVDEFLVHYTSYLTDNPINEEVVSYTELSIQGIRQPPYEVELVDKQGTVRRLEVLEVPIKDEDGEVVGVEGIAHDITERKAVELELEDAKNRAEAATQAKSWFLANMSHEIRTPLHAVLGLTRLLQDSSLGEDQREYVDSILESGESLLSLVNGILDFSKVEAGKLELEEGPFELRHLLEASVNLMAGRAEAKDLKVETAVDDDVPTHLVGDANRIRQVLVNLLDNAVKFTREGKVELGVTVDRSQGEVRFRVRDTGIGIPADRVRRLFKPFSQVDASTTREYGGTGLGLAISRRLCEVMGGEIGVESEPGVGTTFAFTLPLQEVAAEQGPADRQDAVDVSGLRILVAEDNRVNRLVAQRMLEALGCRVDTVSNGAQVLETMRGAEYDMVLMDLQMPEMDGLEAARRIRGERLGGQPWVVAMTANATPSDREACQEVGMNDYLTKPVDPETLRAVLVGCDRARSLAE